MAQYLALDWDATEVRYLAATAVGTRVKILATGAHAIPASEQAETTPQQIGQALREALAKAKPRRGTVLVGLGRNDVELINLTLPPARDAELAELVRHSVFRQLPQLGEEAAIDFVPLSQDASQPRAVAAVICADESLQRAKRVCQEAGVTPDRLLLRPFALAPFAAAEGDGAPPVSLIVCQAGEHLDLAVVAEARVVYSRTVRLPHGEEEAAQLARLAAEIQRTLLVAPQAEGAQRPVERLVLLGANRQLAPLVRRMEQELALPVLTIDPLAELGPPDAADDGHTGRFAALVGMVQDEIQRRHVVDFLNPRQPPAPPNRRRQLTIAAAVVALLAAVGGYYIWDSLAELDRQNAALAQRLNELEQSLKKAARKRIVAESIQAWQASHVNWLDELRDFCSRFPSSRDAVILRLALSPSREGGGEFDFNGVVRDPAIVLRMENRIRDDFHQMRSPRVQERVQDKNFSWHFESRVVVRPRSREQYVAHFTGALPAGDQQPVDGQVEKTVPVAAASRPDVEAAAQEPDHDK